MRRLRYNVAMSLDGFIAGPNGEFDWIVRDPAIDFGLIHAQFDTLLMGRKTFEVARSLNLETHPGERWIVVSHTLKPDEYPGITILNGEVAEAVASMKAQSGKDIWLMGGGILFRSLLDADLVDTVEVFLMPVVLGNGVPLLPEGRRRTLHLEESKALPSGILVLRYLVVPES